MHHHEVRHMTKETHRAKETVLEFFKACVPFGLRPYFTSAAMRHHAEIHSQVDKLKKMVESPNDIPTHCVACAAYVKESKKLIRAVSFVLLRAFPNGAPDPRKEKTQEEFDL